MCKSVAVIAPCYGRIDELLVSIMKVYLYLLRLVFVVAFSIATAVSGAVHRMPSEPVDASFATYLQAGFAVDDFCGDVPGVNAGSGFCEYCNLAGAALVPEMSGFCRREFEHVRQVWQSLATLVSIPCYDDCHAARAPPAF